MRSWRSAACLVGLVVLSFGLSWGHVHEYGTVSPMDELQHLDYLIQIGDGHIARLGDQFTQEAMRLEACHRLDNEYDIKVPKCEADPAHAYEVTDFQEGGYNTAAIHPPTYYAVDNVIGRLLSRLLPGDQDMLVAGRMAGAFWLAGGAVLLWFLCREMGSDRILATALSSAVIVSPTILHASAVVTNDGTSILVGAALVLAVLRWERQRIPLWVPSILAALAAATKVTNLLAVALVIVYLLVRALARGSVDEGSVDRLRAVVRDDRRVVIGVAWIAGAAGAAALVWAGLSAKLRTVSPQEIPMVERFTVTRFPVGGFVDSWIQTISPLSGGYIAPFLRSEMYVLFTGAFAFLIVAAVVASAIRSQRGTRERSLAVAILVLLALAGPTLVIFNYVVQGIYVVIPPRYGIVLVPAMAAASVPVLAGRVGRWGTSIIAGGAVVCAFVAMV